MYDSFSVYYDYFVDWSSRLAFEMPFIVKQLLQLHPMPQPYRVLDSACGTGMHAIALVQAGFLAAGADLSSGMIERARIQAAAAKVNVPFIVAGFGGQAQAFAGSNMFPFDALLCLGNSLPHVLSPGDLATALADFAACLRPGGLVLIQSRNFDAVMASRERWMEPQAYRKGESEWVFLRFYDYAADGLIDFNIVTLRREGSGKWVQAVSARRGLLKGERTTNTVTLRREGSGKWVQTVSTTRLRPLLQAELTVALAAAGFGEITCYGSMTGEPFDAKTSGNLIVTANRG